MIQRLRRIGIGQMAKLLGALYFALGILFAVIFGLAGSMMPTSELGGGATMFGTAFVIAIPFIYGVLGVVFGALIAWLYNIVASWTGGLELEFESSAVQAH